jgi:hypothetical protein
VTAGESRFGSRKITCTDRPTAGGVVFLSLVF